MMFNNLGLIGRIPLRRRVYPVQRPVIQQFGGGGSDFFINGSMGPPGPPGISVVSAEVSPNPGDLLIYLSDGSEINAGNVIGPPGPPGPPGHGGCNVVNVKLVGADYTAQASDYYIGATQNNISITLPVSVVGKVFCIKNQINGNVKVKASNNQTIDSASSKTLGTEDSLTVIFDGSRWNVI